MQFLCDLFHAQVRLKGRRLSMYPGVILMIDDAMPLTSQITQITHVMRQYSIIPPQYLSVIGPEDPIVGPGLQGQTVSADQRDFSRRHDRRTSPTSVARPVIDDGHSTRACIGHGNHPYLPSQFIIGDFDPDKHSDDLAAPVASDIAFAEGDTHRDSDEGDSFVLVGHS